jgi:hypothetical protein
MDFVIITAADDKYIKTLQNFIYSFTLDINCLIVYDLGLNDENKKIIHELNQIYSFTFKKFDYNGYPEHVDIKKYNGLFCSYAFKPIIIYNEANNILNEGKYVIWMDSANRFNKNSIELIYNSLVKYGIYSPISANENTIESIELNHRDCVDHYNISPFEHIYSLTSRSANVVAIDYKSQCGFSILNDWYKASLDKDIICPNGSSRNNHRQDQTVLSILMYLYEKNNTVIFDKNNFDVSFWNKYDITTIQSGYYPFKLIDKNTHIQLATIYCKNINDAVNEYAYRKKIDSDKLLQLFFIQ